jgi:Ti-type conjugative transfer relaxase TraA
MAIQFSRLDFVKRSVDKNACAKSAYNARDAVYFKGTQFQESKNYDWSHKEPNVYHSVLLPENADPKFLDKEYLWNTVEQKENRKNSQTALEMVLALPDDAVISDEDCRVLSIGFFQKYFVDKGLIVQLDIHAATKKTILNVETGELEEYNCNRHAHALITTRRLKENGQEFCDHKARDLMPEVRLYRVIEAEAWGKHWAEYQNQEFEKNGLDLRVDPCGIIPEKHLGPVRMRHPAFNNLENEIRHELNQIESQEPDKILENLTATKNIFTVEDVERFLIKHIFLDRENVRNAFWKQEQVIQLIDCKTNQPLNKFTSQIVLEEEQRIMRLADSIQKNKGFFIQDISVAKALNTEQKVAFKNIIDGQKLSCIEGFAGTGKSHLLIALKNAYEAEGYIVRGFGPDHATVQVLKEKGFIEAQTLHRFLFSFHHQKENIHKNKEVWIIDEAGKLGNKPLEEFLKALKQAKAQVILSGDSAQFSSVERGGMFKNFSERYGAQKLVNIQRQKHDQDRLIAKDLATGKMGYAIDLLAKQQGIHWTTNENEAKETLVQRWAIDQAAFPNQTAIIIAHANQDVKELNELVHLYRKEKGELGEKDYLCETMHGKILVSTGDHLEFRGTNKKLGLTNGMIGTLIKASPKQFTVKLKEIEREISFNPKDYQAFQLAYASTNYRSQGKTIDRAYVLHSKNLDKAGFYVGLTRHVDRAHLFVAKTQVSCLADLKKQAYRSTKKVTTLGFTTAKEITQQQQQLERQEHIQALKEDTSLLAKAKGYALSTWDYWKEKTLDFRQNSTDLKPNQTFFNPKSASQHLISLPALEVQVDYHLGRQRIVDEKKQATFDKQMRPILSASKPQPDIANKTPLNGVASIQKQQMQAQHWQQLSEKNQQAIHLYQKSKQETSQWFTIAQTDDSKTSIWKKACIERNTQAYQIMHSLKKETLPLVFSPQSLKILEDQAQRHAAILAQKENTTSSLESKLQGQIESLLYTLFPEGPTKKTTKELRFGAKGSLCVTCQGKQAGCFYDFQKQEGGGLIRLIQTKFNYELKEAKEWAQNFLGEIKPPVPSQFSFKKENIEKEITWISLKPDLKVPAPSLEQIAPKLGQFYHESARHAYCNAEGELLFYILRLTDKNDPTKKSILPLSYGRQQEGSASPVWMLKGYQTDKRSLYHLEQLKEQPAAKILIVEGEKTADQALNQFKDKNLICVTWSGGAAAVKKTDWSPLFGREIVIWPDNDEVGFKAATDICSELRKTGVQSLAVVSPTLLAKNFPLKWDLADPLPAGVSPSLTKDLLLMAEEKSVGIQDLFSAYNCQHKIDPQDQLLIKLQLKEVLWRVEERLRPELETQYGGKSWEIKNCLIAATLQVFNQKVDIQNKLKTEFGIEGEINQKIAHQIVLQQASTGYAMTKNQILEIKNALSFYSPLRTNQPTCKDYVEQQALTAILEVKHVIQNDQNSFKSFFQKEASKIDHQLTHIIKQEQIIQTIIMQQKQQSRSFDLSL